MPTRSQWAALATVGESARWCVAERALCGAPYLSIRSSVLLKQHSR